MANTLTSRVVIIGAGRVGSHCAMSLIPGHLADEIVLIDSNHPLAEAQAADLYDFATGMSSTVAVRAGTYDDCDDASFVLVAAGRGRRATETRLELLHDTLAAITDIAVRLSRTRFAGVAICITNPVDVVTEYLRQQLDLPAGHVLGTGSALDTIRLRRMLAQRTGVDVAQIQGFCMGEHGDSSFVAWSHVSLGGVPLAEYVRMHDEPERRLVLAEIQDKIHGAGASIIAGKGCTEFGIGSVVTDIVRAVSRDQTRVLPLSAHLEGEYGQRDISIGVPCAIGAGGIRRVLEVELTQQEAELFARSCNVLRRAREA